MLTINNKKYLKIILFVVVVIYISVRYDALNFHFSHIDDLAVPYIISKDYKDGVLSKMNLSKNKEKIFSKTYPFLEPLVKAFAIAKYTTYAPFQFIFTSFLVDKKDNYKKTIFWSRFPSFIFSVLSAFLLIYIFKILYHKWYLQLSIFGVLILGLSWTHIIHTAQSYSYAIGITSYFIFIIILIKSTSIIKFKTIEVLLYSLLIAILFFTNYQSIFLVSGLVFTIFYLNRNKLKIIFPKLCIFFSIIFFGFSLVYYIFLSEYTHRGVVDWNKGPNNEFFLSFNGLTIIESILHFIKFFFVNFYIVFKFLISFVSENNIINVFFSLLYIILFIIGIFSLIKSKDIKKKSLSYFLITTIFVWIVLVVLKKITFSPTRHSLVLLSFISIFVPFGFIYVYKKCKKKSPIYILTFIIITITLFFIDYNNIKKSRTDKFYPHEIENIIKKYNISSVCSYDATCNLLFMDFIKNRFKKNIHSYGSIIFYENDTLISNQKVLFITHRNTPLSEKIITTYLSRFNKDNDFKYDIILKREDISNTQIEFSSLTKNGPNSLLIYIVKFKKIT